MVLCEADILEMIKRWFKRIVVSIPISLTWLAIIAVVASAAVGIITDFTGTATDTTITLRWTLAPSSNSTVIRYSTATFPAAVDAGSSAYNGTASSTILEGLTQGTPYFFSAWGYDGTDYSAVSAPLALTTLFTVSENTTIPISRPFLPVEMWQIPSTAGWSLAPITDIFAYFADPAETHSGLGMPTDNLISSVVALIIFVIGLKVFARWHNLFGAYILVLVLSFMAMGIGIMQGMVLAVLLSIGLGVWALQKSQQ